MQITDAIAQLCKTHTIIAPNERLAREFIHAYDHKQHASGLTGWPTVHVQSLRSFLNAEFHRYTEAQSNPSRLVSVDELLVLFFSFAPADQAHLSTSARDAFRTLRRYRIHTSVPELVSGRGRTFTKWIADVVDELANAVTEDEVGDFLRSHDTPPAHPMLLMDFDQLTPIELDYLQFTQQSQQVLSLAGQQEPIKFESSTFAPQEISPSSSANSVAKSARIIACQSLNEEIASAARWAYEIKSQPSKGAPPRIGVIVPNLAEHYDLVQRQFAATLDPDTGSATNAFDIAAGKPLARHQVWQHARRLLVWSQHRISAQWLYGLAQSPFLRLHLLEPLVERWPSRLRKHVSMQDLKGHIGGNSRLANPQPADALSADALSTDTPSRDTFGQLLNQVDQLPSTDRLRGWIRSFLNILDTVGWPNTSAIGSFQYQAYEAVLEALQHAAKVDHGATIDFDTALGLVETLLAARTFAPQRVHADIHVLGLLETTGLTFSHLWVAAMDAESFPQKTAANAFLPRTLLNRHSVPRSSQDDELRFATALMSRWRAQADSLRFSFTEVHDESQRRPSVLIDRALVGASGPTVAEVALVDWHPFYVPQKVQLETVVDTHGSQQAVGPVKGGVGFLREQTQCPFRAYAIYRLGLREPRQPIDFPDALARGIATHEVLAALLRTAPSQSDLARLVQADIDTIVAETLDQIDHTMPAEFHAREQQRIGETVSAWIAAESKRDDFTAIHIETDFSIDLDGLRFNVRVDRIDQTEQGLLVLDYKTGQIQLSATQTTPVRDPQLPIYSLLVENVQGVYYAQLREGSVRLAGIAGQRLLESARTIVPTQPWAEQLREWESVLTSTSRQIAAGDARVAPVGSVCNNCHLHSFCRIGDAQ